MGSFEPDDFERQLRDALARQEPPGWLEARVQARAMEKRPRRGLFRWAVATASAAAIATGLWTDHQTAVRERIEGQAAKARLQVALKVTVTELGKIQRTLQTATGEE
jgi:hypothetical protein